MTLISIFQVLLPPLGCYLSNAESLHGRYRGSGADHHLPPRISHLPSTIPTSVFVLCPSRCTQGSLTLWSSGMRKDHARKGACQGIWSNVYQHCSICTDKQVVWRVEQARSRPILTSEKDSTKYCVHWWDRFVLKGENERWPWSHRDDEGWVHDVCIFLVEALSLLLNLGSGYGMVCYQVQIVSLFLGLQIVQMTLTPQFFGECLSVSPLGYLEKTSGWRY